MPLTDMSRAWVVLWLCALSAGCGQSHECIVAGSGLAGCQSLGSLSEADIEQYCRWEYGLHASPGLRECEDRFAVPQTDVEGCIYRVQAAADRNCTRTVLEHERCAAATVEDPCNAQEPVCTDIPSCTPESGADAGM
ncbi:MAG TPA: hypothetical protein DEF51_14595 [Myxococcales bacterium]|nr:hypothetical protein [Myxococcales bacterium]